jgi:hypothetical protein
MCVSWRRAQESSGFSSAVVNKCSKKRLTFPLETRYRFVQDSRYSNMTRWRWALLIFELVLFAVILILPQVDLPDFTFHGGTAPVVAKAKLSAPPVLAVFHVPTQPHSVNVSFHATGEQPSIKSALVSPSLLSLLCSFLC